MAAKKTTAKATKKAPSKKAAKKTSKKAAKKPATKVLHIKSAEVLKWDAKNKAVITKSQLLTILNEFRDLLIDDIVKGLEMAK